MEVTALQLPITLQRWGDCLGSKQPFSSESFSVLNPFEKPETNAVANGPESVWRTIHSNPKKDRTLTFDLATFRFLLVIPLFKEPHSATLTINCIVPKHVYHRMSTCPCAGGDYLQAGVG